MKNSIKIGHLADSHLKDARLGNPKKGEDFYLGLVSALEAGEKEVDLFVHVGDIFDVARPGPRVIGQLMQVDQLLKKMKKKMLCVTGNHDWNATPWFRVLFPSPGEYGIHPLDDASCEFGGFRFTGVRPHNAASFMENYNAIQQLTENADVVLYHGFVAGIVPIHTGDKIVLNVDQLPRSAKNKAILLGDIHVQRYIKKGGCLIGYPGSTEVIKKDEDLEKSMPIVTLSREDASLSGGVAIKTRKYLTAKITTADALEDFVKLVKDNAHLHPVVNFQYDNEVPGVLSRVFAVADPTKCLVRPEKLPRQKESMSRDSSDVGDQGLSVTDFFRQSLGEPEDIDILKLALDIMNQPEDVTPLVQHFIEEQIKQINQQLQ